MKEGGEAGQNRGNVKCGRQGGGVGAGVGWGWRAKAKGGTGGEGRRGELKSAQLDCHVNSCADR